MNTELDLKNFIQACIDKRKTILGIVASFFIFSIIYSLLLTENYKTYAYIIPPLEKDVQALKLSSSVLGQLDSAANPWTQKRVYDTYVRNIQSRKLQREYFFNNKLYKYFDNTNIEDSFEKNFHQQLFFKIESKTASKELREQYFLSISFIHTDPQLAAKWLNEYIKMVNEQTSSDLVDAVNRTLFNTKNMLEGKIIAKRKLAKKLTLDRIEQLNEALVLAKELGINEKQDYTSNLQSVIVGEESTAVTQAPLYFLGTKILQAEIQSLQNRESEDPFIPGLRILEEHIGTLEHSKLVYGDVKAAEIDQPATAPTVRNSPKRKLIVFVITFLGFLLSFLYILITNFFRTKE
tara:strand:- start:122 stop:1171 length:1050 start_codon:yes stop_codon:yes gene_type:complete